MYDSSSIRASLVFLCFYWITNSDGAVTVLNNSHYAPEGETTSINCSVTDEAFIGWFDSKGQKISNDPSQRLHAKNVGNIHYLEIDRVNKTDNGQYECRGETNKAQMTLHVEYRPGLTRERSSPNTVYASLGRDEEVTLNCVFDGSPVPRVLFRTFEGELNSSGITYGPGSASFKFKVKSQSDFGFYTCKATNSRGSDSYTIEVHVRGTPEPPNNVRVSPKCDRIVVTWDPAEKDGGSSVIGYNIELRREGKILKSESLPIASRDNTFKDLKARTLYEVRMSSNNSFGVGEWRIVSVNTTVACSKKALSSAAGEFPFLFAWIISATLILLVTVPVH